MLVSKVGQVIDALNVVPDPLCRKLNGFKRLLNIARFGLVRNNSTRVFGVNILEVLVGIGNRD